MLTTQSSINFPSNLRIEGELVDVKARHVARRSGVFHSVPRREKVLSLDAHEVVSPLGFVANHARATKHQSFAARFNDSIGKLRRFIAESDDATLRGHHDFVAKPIRKLHSIRPFTAGVWKVKRNEAAGICEHSVTHGVHGLDVFATPAPNLTVKRNAARKLTSEAGRSFDNVAIASPKLVAVPKGAASVKLLAPEISGAVPEIPVSSKSHVCLVHGETLTPNAEPCLVRFITERHSMSYAR